jgi:hypothetical protein
MKATEAARIVGLLAARKPPVAYEEVTIEGVRMLVIIGKEADTVIRFSRGGSADMPQISSYPETAEAAAYADEKLAKQRASGRRNTTGEGNDWPRNWKLDRAKAAGKIWYANSRPIRLKSDNMTTASVKFSVKQLTAEELRSTHEKYVQTVPNSYATAVRRVGAALGSQNTDELASAVADWLQDLNRQYFRFRPDEAKTLKERLLPIAQTNIGVLVRLHARSLKSLTPSDKSEVLQLFNVLRAECGPVGAGKALHIFSPNFFPLWDDKIAAGYGVMKDSEGYFQFMNLIREQVRHLPEDIVSGVSTLKILDEYNYLQISANAACA